MCLQELNAKPLQFYFGGENKTLFGNCHTLLQKKRLSTLFTAVSGDYRDTALT